ncbi:adenosylcobyric acid synthase [Bacillus pakistanensis]|uniref:Cobyric acid synthase n=1 Tax=Rossellomorea pakistanensis TaxID=992288 RepID=A0ABS2N7M7_9BACI|nr:cobyric acid synthase [Bacillus pakistanensis]MBM7583838.1 adenosylcobyric acid synthase [Bacillus pakistanensis]
MRGIMIQGTASDVGKSLIATAICRILANEGESVAPFKSQNMSNNSYITVDGKEIGRAQGIQAEAAKVEANVYMNPILLKPKSDQQSEIVLFGKAQTSLTGKSYRDNFYEKGLQAIEESLNWIQSHYNWIIMEGAGSPVEINLKSKELVNMKVAELADIPVLLVADIDRGGVFASIIGTLELLEPHEKKRVKGILINKFRGDQTLFEDGVQWIEKRTGIPVIGVVPYITHRIEGEDSLSLNSRFKPMAHSTIDIAIIHFPYISNYSDFEPFTFEPDVSIRWVQSSDDFGNPDVVILPGTKSTIRDRQFLQSSGLEEKVIKFINEDGFLVGICGGYQMLGQTLIDESGMDTGVLMLQEKGLGILPLQTRFLMNKMTERVKGTLHPRNKFLTTTTIDGFEIHLGQSKWLKEVEPFLLLEDGRGEGCVVNNGTIIGSYMHHLFHNDEWRNEWLNTIRTRKGLPLKPMVPVHAMRDISLDQLAEEVKSHLNWSLLKKVMMSS